MFRMRKLESQSNFLRKFNTKSTLNQAQSYSSSLIWFYCATDMRPTATATAYHYLLQKWRIILKNYTLTLWSVEIVDLVVSNLKMQEIVTILQWITEWIILFMILWKNCLCFALLIWSLACSCSMYRWYSCELTHGFKLEFKNKYKISRNFHCVCALWAHKIALNPANWWRSVRTNANSNSNKNEMNISMCGIWWIMAGIKHV